MLLDNELLINIREDILEKGISTFYTYINKDYESKQNETFIYIYHLPQKRTFTAYFDIYSKRGKRKRIRFIKETLSDILDKLEEYGE